MKDFNYCAPTRVIFGKNTELEVGKALKNAGATRVLMQYGGGSIKKSGLYDRVVKAIRDEGIELFELGGVQPNPHLSLVRKAIEIVREQKIDYLLAVGGGSAIDSTKATAVGAVYDGNVWDFYCGKAVPKKAMPVGVVLTIPAAGSEGSNSSVITKEEGGIKRGYNDEICRPKFAIMNPELTMTLPDYQTACGCTDILMHTMERYFTQGDSLEITDSIAEGLLRTVMAQAVILAAADYLRAYAIDCILTCFLFCLIGYFSGLGRTTFVMFQGIAGAFLVRIPVSFFMSRQPDASLFRIGLATPMSTVLQILLCFAYLCLLQRAERKEHRL